MSHQPEPVLESAPDGAHPMVWRVVGVARMVAFFLIVYAIGAGIYRIIEDRWLFDGFPLTPSDWLEKHLCSLRNMENPKHPFCSRSIIEQRFTSLVLIAFFGTLLVPFDWVRTGATLAFGPLPPKLPWRESAPGPDAPSSDAESDETAQYSWVWGAVRVLVGGPVRTLLGLHNHVRSAFNFPGLIQSRRSLIDEVAHLSGVRTDLSRSTRWEIAITVEGDPLFLVVGGTLSVSLVLPEGVCFPRCIAFDVWVDWPATERVWAANGEANPRLGSRPLGLEHAVADCGYAVYLSTRRRLLGASGVYGLVTRVTLVNLNQPTSAHRVTFTARCPELLVPLRRRPPFEQRRLSLGFDSTYAPAGVRPMVLAVVRKAKHMRLLWRVDSADYMSLPSSEKDDSTRYTLVFRQRAPEVSPLVRLRFTFGHAVLDRLMEPAIILLFGGGALTATGLAVHLTGKGQSINLFIFSSVIFTLVVWFASLVQRRTLFSPSADHGHTSYTAVFGGGTAAAFVAFLGLYALLFDLNGSRPTTAMRSLGLAGICFGAVLIAGSLKFAYSVYRGRLQGFRCDRCEALLEDRHWNVSRDPLSRRVLCSRCIIESDLTGGTSN